MLSDEIQTLRFRGVMVFSSTEVPERNIALVHASTLCGSKCSRFQGLLSLFLFEVSRYKTGKVSS